MKENEIKQEEVNEKKNIKNLRVKSYFIQATKEIILKEGVENVSVRKVADQAGYSFTTIYNYFKDLNELLQEVKNHMIQDVVIYMKESIPESNYEIEDIKRLHRQYIEYYIERPNIFRFFYSYRLHPVIENSSVAFDFSKLYYETYQGFLIKGIIKESEIPVIAKTFIYTLHGLLALYFSDNGMTKDILYDDLENIIEYLLKERNQI